MGAERHYFIPPLCAEEDHVSLRVPAPRKTEMSDARGETYSSTSPIMTITAL
jgi:hypothetical protein